MSRDRRLIQLILSLLQALIFVVVLGWIFVPIYIKAGVSQTTPLTCLCCSCLQLRAGIVQSHYEWHEIQVCQNSTLLYQSTWKMRILCSKTWAEKYLVLSPCSPLIPRAALPWNCNCSCLILCSSLTVSECQKSSSNLICACSPLSKTFSTSTGGDNARVSEEAFWWETDPDLPVSPFLGHLYFHKDLSKWNFYSISSILHWSKK